MIREIVTYGDPVLRAKCRMVGDVTEETRTLAADMVETMHAAGGVGLAAPQVGEDIQLAVVDVRHDPSSFTVFRLDGKDVDGREWMPLVFFDPVLDNEGERATEEEGCLSLPELRGSVRRPAALRGKMTLLDGRRVTVEADGLLARAIRHEVDHLNGILFIDRLSAAAKVGMRRALRQLAAETPHRYLPGSRARPPA